MYSVNIFKKTKKKKKKRNPINMEFWYNKVTAKGLHRIS